MAFSSVHDCSPLGFVLKENSLPYKALRTDLFSDLHLEMVMQSLELSFKIFPLSSLLVNNVLDSVPLQLYMAVNALKHNRLVLLPEVRESYSGGSSKESSVLQLYLIPPSQHGILISLQTFLTDLLIPLKN